MPTPNWANQTIWTGDNLLIMRGMNSSSVDLIYLDPPFNSKANYAAPIGSKAAGGSICASNCNLPVDAQASVLNAANSVALLKRGAALAQSVFHVRHDQGSLVSADIVVGRYCKRCPPAVSQR